MKIIDRFVKTCGNMELVWFQAIFPNSRDPKRFPVNQQPIQKKMMIIVPGSVAG
jgi:hypothetical protein